MELDGKAAWVTINSSYYIEDALQPLLRTDDVVYVVGHRSYNDIKSTDMVDYHLALSRDSEFNGFYMNMGIVNTADKYLHPTSELLKYNIKTPISKTKFNSYSRRSGLGVCLSYTCKPQKTSMSDNDMVY